MSVGAPQTGAAGPPRSYRPAGTKEPQVSETTIREPIQQRRGVRIAAGCMLLAAVAGVYLYVTAPNDGSPDTRVEPEPWSPFARSDHETAGVHRDESAACAAALTLGAAPTKAAADLDRAAVSDVVMRDDRVVFVALARCGQGPAIVVGVADRTVELVKHGPGGTPILVHLAHPIEPLAG